MTFCVVMLGVSASIKTLYPKKQGAPCANDKGCLSASEVESAEFALLGSSEGVSGESVALLEVDDKHPYFVDTYIDNICR